MVRGDGDSEASRAEVEKAYSQADAYRKENERLKKQLDQVLCPPAPASRLPAPRFSAHTSRPCARFWPISPPSFSLSATTLGPGDGPGSGTAQPCLPRRLAAPLW